MCSVSPSGCIVLGSQCDCYGVVGSGLVCQWCGCTSILPLSHYVGQCGSVGFGKRVECRSVPAVSTGLPLPCCLMLPPILLCPIILFPLCIVGNVLTLQGLFSCVVVQGSVLQPRPFAVRLGGLPTCACRFVMICSLAVGPPSTVWAYSLYSGVECFGLPRVTAGWQDVPFHWDSPLSGYKHVRRLCCVRRACLSWPISLVPLCRPTECACYVGLCQATGTGWTYLFSCIPQSRTQASIRMFCVELLTAQVGSHSPPKIDSVSWLFGSLHCFKSFVQGCLRPRKSFCFFLQNSFPTSRLVVVHSLFFFQADVGGSDRLVLE